MAIVTAAKAAFLPQITQVNFHRLHGFLVFDKQLCNL